MRFALNPRILFEATAIKVASSNGEVDAESLDRRIRQLEKRSAAAPAKAASDGQSYAVRNEGKTEQPRTEPALPAAGVKDYNCAFAFIEMTYDTTRDRKSVV